MSAEKRDSGCICHGNWRAIIKACDHLIGRHYRRDIDGTVWRFYGVVHADDDYYYGLFSRDQVPRLISCAGSIESCGYTLMEGKK